VIAAKMRKYSIKDFFIFTKINKNSYPFMNQAVYNNQQNIKEKRTIKI
jgi:hypothetical protein